MWYTTVDHRPQLMPIAGIHRAAGAAARGLLDTADKTQYDTRSSAK
jgi:hypothetical protein